MRSCVLGMLLAATAIGCARSSGQSDVPTAPLSRESAGITHTVSVSRTKVAPAPGPQGVPDVQVKRMP